MVPRSNLVTGHEIIWSLLSFVRVLLSSVVMLVILQFIKVRLSRLSSLLLLKLVSDGLSETNYCN